MSRKPVHDAAPPYSASVAVPKPCAPPGAAPALEALATNRAVRDLSGDAARDPSSADTHWAVPRNGI